MSRVRPKGETDHLLPLNRGWLFGGPTTKGATRPDFDDRAFAKVAIPHGGAASSWRDVDRSAYEHVSIYRRHFALPPALRDRRVFADFGAAMASATVFVNGVRLGEHVGGYTPFSFELTPHLDARGDNVLAVEVDSRRDRHDAPPFGRALHVHPPGGFDFDTFGGIHGDVRLRAVSDVFIEDVFARPTEVLNPHRRRLAVRCSLDAVPGAEGPVRVEAELRDGGRVVSRAATDAGPADGAVRVSLDGLDGVEPWDVERPKLYEVRVGLSREGETVHSRKTRVGFREARFEPGGFFLNGRRLGLFGLNRHQLFPYVGNAMPARVQRRDAEILKEELNCNIVRTSHYPQSPHFLDACDELGLLVWEEMPGWQHVGDGAWQAAAAGQARRMILRDRNHASVVLWGVRINESERDEPALYDGLHRMAHELDPSRQTTGAYNKDQPLRQDVKGINEYGTAQPRPKARPYLISEAVGQWGYEGGTFKQYYRRTDPGPVQQAQAERHATAHQKYVAEERCAGFIAWCAFDYNSPVNSYRDVKTPGVFDLFRIPKPGAAIYLSQRDPAERAVIEPAFYWDFGPGSPPDGPGSRAMICSNCDRLEVYVDDGHLATLEPDRERFGDLPYPPFFADLRVDGANLPELGIEGFVGDRMAASRRFSSDRAGDRLLLRADDGSIVGDGIDATRLVFRAVDRHGAPRPYVEGDVAFELDGPAEIVGDNPFAFGDAGGVGAVWLRGAGGGAGSVKIRALHPTLGAAESVVEVEDGSVKAHG